jgi:hypothetical protein
LLQVLGENFISVVVLLSTVFLVELDLESLELGSSILFVGHGGVAEEKDGSQQGHGSQSEQNFFHFK